STRLTRSKFIPVGTSCMLVHFIESYAFTTPGRCSASPPTTVEGPALAAAEEGSTTTAVCWISHVRVMVACSHRQAVM
ncbi:hypothetical protein FOZ63_010872, partial [Perkinsus olseni]